MCYVHDLWKGLSFGQFSLLDSCSLGILISLFFLFDWCSINLKCNISPWDHLHQMNNICTLFFFVDIVILTDNNKILFSHFQSHFWHQKYSIQSRKIVFFIKSWLDLSLNSLNYVDFIWFTLPQFTQLKVT